MPSTRPCWASDFPAPNQTASGPAIAKKPTVAMNVTKIELSATGTGTPARFMTHVDIGADPEPKPSSDPVHGRQNESHEHPAPVQAQEGSQKNVDAIAEANQVIADE